MPMLSDFAIRLAGGLAAMLLVTPWRVVPPAFYRTHCLVALGLLVLAALDPGGAGDDARSRAITIAAAVLAYLASVFWGLGIRRLAAPATGAIALLASFLMFRAGTPGLGPITGLNLAGRLASSALLGSTLTAMLLGHHYLTTPAMSIDPLRRFVRGMAGSLAIRAGIAAIGCVIVFRSGGRASLSPLFLGMRWGMGILGPTVATWLAWKTVAIRSTQSATGILYIAMTLVLFGELSAMVLSRSAGIIL